MRRSRLVVLLLVSSIALLVPAATAGAAPGFAPSATGCPAFWEAEDPPNVATEEIHYSAGPFGTTNQHLTGIGLSTDGTKLTATMRVMDMKRQVIPPYPKTGWNMTVRQRIGATTRTFNLIALYDLPSDSFSYLAKRGNTYVPATGTAVLGAGGGVAVSASLQDLQLAAGSELEQISATAYSFFHYFYMTDPHTGIFSYRTTIAPVERVPLVPCPGVSFTAYDLSDGHVQAIGYALPAASQPVTLEALRDGAWTRLAQSSTDDLGGYLLEANVGAGEHVLRMVLETRYLGTVASAPFTVLVS